jgi:sugar phosphate isomerase/epimerase
MIGGAAGVHATGAKVRVNQLGVQAHCLRSEIAADLDRTLAAVAELGITALEMTSFPGCRGNWWGDFGAAADLPPQAIAARIRRAGLQCPSVMVAERELSAEQFNKTIDWVLGLGCPRLVLTSFTVAATRTCDDWHRAFARVEECADRVGASGLEFVLHTQPDLWTSDGGRYALDELRRWLVRKSRRLEFDPTGAIIYGRDPAAFARQCLGSLYALHLRDGITPAEPAFYLAAEPLGTGEVNWPGLLQAAGSSAAEWYILEMEVADRTQVFAALRNSLDYLRGRGLIETGPAPTHAYR